MSIARVVIKMPIGKFEMVCSDHVQRHAVLSDGITLLGHILTANIEGQNNERFLVLTADLQDTRSARELLNGDGTCVVRLNGKKDLLNQWFLPTMVECQQSGSGFLSIFKRIDNISNRCAARDGQ